MSRPLYEILSEYMGKPPAEQLVPARWASDFIESKKVAQARGEMRKEWLEALAAYPRRGYLAWWNECPVGKIDGPSVAMWYDWLRKTFPELGQYTIRHIVNNFGTFCRHLRRVGALDAIPELPRVRVPKKKRTVPNRDGLKRILEAIPDELRGLFLARAYAGLRPAEARRLNVGDYKAGVLTLRAEVVKTDEERRLPIGAVCPVLAAWIETHRGDAKAWEPLFPMPRARDKRWKPSPERRAWLKALKAAGVEHVKPNLGGRHAFATHEVHAGTPLDAVRDFMGHASIKTTEIYMHTDTQALALRMRPVQPAKKEETG